MAAITGSTGMRGNRFASVWLASVVLGLATAGEAAALQVLDQEKLEFTCTK